MAHRIICGACKGSHETKRDVFWCYRMKSTRAAHLAAAANTKTAEPDAPPAWPLKTPRAMVEQIREGRYAVQPDDNTPLTFVRVWKPKKGKRAGQIIFQTQHAERYTIRAILFPSGVIKVYDRRIDQPLLLVCVNPVQAAIRYGTELGRCTRCSIELTDPRSRWYGIGPECEKHWPDLITFVNENKGNYQGV